MDNFKYKGLDCTVLRVKADRPSEVSLHGKGNEITILFIEEIKYSQKGHISEEQVKEWLDEIIPETESEVIPRQWTTYQDSETGQFLRNS